MKKLAFKAIISTLLLLIVIFLALTGAMLYFGKTGVILGFSRHVLRNAHTLIGTVLCLFAAVHLGINMRMYRKELFALFKRRGK